MKVQVNRLFEKADVDKWQKALKINGKRSLTHFMEDTLNQQAEIILLDNKTKKK